MYYLNLTDTDFLYGYLMNMVANMVMLLSAVFRGLSDLLN
jgi:hypothetical protein